MKIPRTLRWQPTDQTLGQGGQGQVVVVKDSTGHFQGEYAIKYLKANLPKVAYDRFDREITAIKNLDDPMIVKIVNHSVPTDDFHFYVMEYNPEAKSLRKLMDSGTNPFYANALKSVKFFINLMNAYNLWAKLNISHRDLSPANVLILPDESIQIIDFGLCRIDDTQTVTESDEGVGTPNYMAPECESGANDNVGKTADIYSIGKLLWSAVTNKTAFSRENGVFRSKSMKEEFPNVPATWHLHHLFEKTIREKIVDRFSDAFEAIKCAERVKMVIEGGYPPLELLSNAVCPSCGWGSLQGFEGSHMVFGNPNPAGIFSVQCGYCGVCFAFSGQRRRDNLDSRTQLT